MKLDYSELFVRAASESFCILIVRQNTKCESGNLKLLCFYYFSVQRKSCAIVWG